jgi:hypothetical protein
MYHANPRISPSMIPEPQVIPTVAAISNDSAPAIPTSHQSLTTTGSPASADATPSPDYTPDAPARYTVGGRSRYGPNPKAHQEESATNNART